MRKFFVRLFNLIYLAGAAISIWALVTRPVINTQVGVSLTSEQVADRLMSIIKSQSGGDSGSGSTEGSEYRISYREEASPSTEDAITREDILAAFPDGFELKVGVKVEAKEAFNINNKELLKNSIAQSIETALNNVIGKVTDGMHSLFSTVSARLAKEELKKQLNEQISQYFEGASEVTDAQVEAIYNNISNAINNPDEPPTVEELANTIVGVKDTETGEYPEGSLLALLEEKKAETGSGMLYTAADPQPTEEQVQADIAKPEAEKTYYIQVVADDPETPDVTEVRYERPTEFILTTYYVEKYDASNVTGEDIADQLAEALTSIPGLVEEQRNPASPTEVEFKATLFSSTYFYSPEGVNAKTFVQGKIFDQTKVYYTIVNADPQPEESVITAETTEVAANRHYVVKTSSGYSFPAKYEAGITYYRLDATMVTEEDYTATVASNKYKVKTGEDTYEWAKTYSAETEYFVETKIVNDVDTALAKLIEQMLGGNKSDEGSGENTEGVARAIHRAEGTSNGSKSKEELQQMIKEYLYKLLPLDAINGFVEKADQYSTYVVLGVIGLAIFPWALFALVTFIRTLRRQKCWTKPWIVFVFAFIQVILGIVLTYGAKYAMPLISKYIPKFAEILEQISLSVDIRTGCLIPSFVYCGFIVLTIVYAFFAHGLKVEYKFQKRAMAIDRARARQRR